MMIFNQKLTVAYNKSFPFKVLSRKRAKDNHELLKESIKQKHLLYQKFIFNSSEENKVAYRIFTEKRLRSLI